MNQAEVAEIGRIVRRFYEANSFPGYEEFETPYDLVERTRQGGYARRLDEELPVGVRVLDAGCGTGQLPLFLSMTQRRVVGVDFCAASLRQGQAFKERFGLRHAAFARMDILQLGFPDACFDYVFCNGVLLTMVDAEAGFQSLCRVLKPGGYIVIGLYNTLGRLFTNVRKTVFRLTGGRGTWLDGYLRRRDVGAEKKRVWYMDQYRHPHDRAFTVDAVLRWFRRAGIAYVNSVPTINPALPQTDADPLFASRPAGGRIAHLLAQLAWIWTQGREGGFFLMIGRKRP